MSRPVKPIDPADYSDRVAIRLRELCDHYESYGAAELAAELTAAGFAISASGCTKWLNGSRDIPLAALPAIAKTFGYQHPAGWLPKYEPPRRRSR